MTFFSLFLINCFLAMSGAIVFIMVYYIHTYQPLFQIKAILLIYMNLDKTIS